MVNYTWNGAIAANQTIDLTADTITVTGNTTINAGVTVTVTTGAGPSDVIDFAGATSVVTATSGILILNGSATNRLRIVQSGLATAWAYGTAWLIQASSTGKLDIQYADLYGVALNRSAGNVTGGDTLYKVRIFNVARTSTSLNIKPAGGTNSYTYLETYSSGTSYSVDFGPSAGTNTFSYIYSKSGLGLGIAISATGGTNTISNLKVENLINAGFWITPTTVTLITNAALVGTNSGLNAGMYINVAVALTITNLISRGGYTSTANLNVNFGAGGSLTLSNAAVLHESVSHGIVTAGANVATFTLSDSLITGRKTAAIHGVYINNANHVFVSSDNDYTENGVANGAGRSILAIAGSTTTSTNDYIAGNNGAQFGVYPVTAAAGSNCADYGDPNFQANVSMDVVNATDASTPSQFTLQAARVSAAATPNLPPTVSGVAVAGITTEGATVTFNTGIAAKSRILLSESTGFDPVSGFEVASPWKYHGMMTEGMADWTMPALAHNHPLADLKAGTTYFFVIECYDAAERRFLSIESSFATTASDVPNVGNVRDTDTVGGVPGTLSSNKILKSNATGDGAGNYNDDNLAVGNVRPVAFGLGLTGDLTNLVATDAAYVALEDTRNSDNGTVAADILLTKSVKIRNVTTNGTLVAGGGAALGAFDNGIFR